MEALEAIGNEIPHPLDRKVFSARIVKSLENAGYAIVRRDADRAALEREIVQLTEERDAAFSDSDHDQQAFLSSEKIGMEWHSRALEAEAKAERLTKALGRYEDWQPMAVTPESLNIRSNDYLHFYIPGEGDEPDQWWTGVWKEAPEGAAMWCRIRVPDGPAEEDLEKLEG